jgi:hypothetical protein
LERNCAHCIGEGISNDKPVLDIRNLKSRALDFRCYVFRHLTCSTNIIIRETESTWWVDRSDIRYRDGPRATASLLPLSWISTDFKLTDYCWFSLVSEEKQDLDKAGVSTLAC